MLGRVDVKLPNSAHTSRHWLIHEVAPDFDLLDVWALPTPGARDDFPVLLSIMTSFDPMQSSSWVVRVLFAAREKLGTLLGWDRDDTGLGSRVQSLRDRVPPDLLARSLPDFDALPAELLYVTDDEFAAEIANETVHGVLHVGWVANEEGGYHGQMAVLVKWNGILGSAYRWLIEPFRHAFVYPTLMRELGERWRDAKAATAEEVPAP